MVITDKDFNRLVSFVQSKYGIDLHQKRQLVTSRLSSTVKGMGYNSFTEYVDYLLKKGSGDDINQLLSRLTTNYTYFMREVESFDYFTSTILPDIVRRHQRDKCLSIWSAACSSGEEPYNVSMYIMDHLGGQASAWDTRMLASDISVDALNKAKKGIYELPDTIPPQWRKNYFKPVGGKMFEVAPKIKQNVIFKQFNLMDPIHFKRKFDVIFCRNVMIYFDQPTKSALARRMFDATVPGGYLIISKAENLPPDTPYTRVATSIFQKR
ncbi:protein-glutamate O-methyltransferase CheR [Acutalibacter muris]|nr:protein-glutamate O-methyltransferase CheR [Acutalibacter muris]MCI9192110.1 protein-glutamate O-methyltransferase CheR [Acutalibacter muris]MCI9543650.1 protein-glutamate O-methyltransferase CheR [Acutalibacter muris]QQR31991.1 protein-glutamate O-methyltransferase CheR [Acutalibacter muris]